jgi:membrane-associated phospholipid phosphatase
MEAACEASRPAGRPPESGKRSRTPESGFPTPSVRSPPPYTEPALMRALWRRLARPAPRFQGGGAFRELHTSRMIFTLFGGMLVVVLCLLFADQPARRWAQGVSPSTRARILALAWIGKGYWMFALASAISLAGWLKERRAADSHSRYQGVRTATTGAFLLGAIALPALAAAILKGVVGRVRPLADSAGVLVLDPWTLDFHHASFPSGDVTNAAALAWAVSCLAPRLVSVAWLLPLVVGFGRVATGRHWVSDVAAGVVLALAGVLLVRQLFLVAGYGFLFAPRRAVRGRRGPPHRPDRRS